MASAVLLLVIRVQHAQSTALKARLPLLPSARPAHLQLRLLPGLLLQQLLQLGHVPHVGLEGRTRPAGMHAGCEGESGRMAAGDS